MKTASIDLSQLWIGDLLKTIDNGLEGTFLGIDHDGKVKMKVNGRIIFVSSNNLVLGEEIQDEHELEFPSLIEEPVVMNSKPTKSFGKEIDLHIEKLNPDIQNAHPQLILDHQLQMCRTFIKDVISKRRNVVTIIHGKGTGVLKEEVLHLLKEFRNVRFTIDVNNGGGQEVWMRY